MKIKMPGYLCLFMLMGALVLLAGCGSDASSPDGSWGQSETNMRVSLLLTPDTKEVDVCNSMAYSVSADLINTVINPSLPENTLFLEEYAVYFSGMTNGAPPLASIGENMGGKLPATGLSASFVDQGMKGAFLNDIVSGAYTPDETYPQYRARYVFSGTDLYGSSWGVAGDIAFRMGRYTACKVLVFPSSIALTGIANPDGNTSDDVTFNITGGAPPYSMLSDTASIINSQGALGAGIANFVIDPDSVGSDTLVTLAVLDSLGETAIAEVTVTTP